MDTASSAVVRLNPRNLSARALIGLGTAALFLGLCAGSSAGAAQVGLGVLLTSKTGDQIFGFDINQSGTDGVLSTAATVSGSTVRISMETFDQDSGAITSTFDNEIGTRDEYGVDGIFAGDIALVTHYVTPSGTIYANRYYNVMNPVTADKFTGTWTSPLPDFDVQQRGENQSTTTAVLYGIELKNNDNPDLIVTDLATNTSSVIHLNPSLFALGNGPNLSQYISANEAVIATSPDYGAVGGEAPLNVIFNLSTGAMTRFQGYNNGYYHAGYVNGLAVDPNTGIAATDTELNSQVEFYNINTQKGITFVQLPCTDNVDQINSGSGIAVDPVNKLFLVTDTYYCSSVNNAVSAIVVYDESGNFVETISGFHFPIGEPPPVLNPSKRMGWAYGGPNGLSQLQQFFY